MVENCAHAHYNSLLCIAYTCIISKLCIVSVRYTSHALLAAQGANIRGGGANECKSTDNNDTLNSQKNTLQIMVENKQSSKLRMLV